MTPRSTRPFEPDVTILRNLGELGWGTTAESGCWGRCWH
jgi:hypothetical protein